VARIAIAFGAASPSGIPAMAELAVNTDTGVHDKLNLLFQPTPFHIHKDTHFAAFRL